MPGYYYDEFAVGRVFEHAIRRTVTETDNVLFCAITHNPQPLHLDAEYARNTDFGQRVFNSMYTVAFACGVSVEDTTLGTLVVNLGFEKMTFPKPVFINDTLHVETLIKETRASRSSSCSSFGRKAFLGVVDFRR